MVSNEIRAEARKSLAGSWGKGVLIVLSYALIMFAIGFIIGLLKYTFIPNFILQIGLWAIGLPLTYGLIAQFIQLKREGTVIYFDFFQKGFTSFSRVWKIYGNILLKMLPAVIIFVVCILSFSFFSTLGIVSSYYMSISSGIYAIIAIVSFLGFLACSIYLIPNTLLYVLSYYIYFDHPELSNKEIVEESARLMNGNRWKLICLFLTFIGWSILCVFTFGIGYLLLIPYIQVSFITFYESLVGISKGNTQIDSSLNEEISDNPISE